MQIKHEVTVTVTHAKTTDQIAAVLKYTIEQLQADGAEYQSHSIHTEYHNPGTAIITVVGYQTRECHL